MASIVENCAVKIAGALAREAKLGRYQEELVAYSLKIILSTVVGYIVLGVISYFLGVFKYSLAILLTMTIFKPATGGAHASSPERCTFIGTMLIIALSYLTVFTFPYFSLVSTLLLVMIVAILTLYCIWIWAPADTPQKPITDEGHRLKLRIASFSLLTIWFLFFNLFTFVNISNWITIASAYALLWHAFLITPSGYAFADFLDGIAKKLYI